MKYLLFLFLFPAAGSAQVYKLRAFETSFSSSGVASSKSVDWNKTDILVVVNEDNNKVKIYAKAPMNIDVVKVDSVYIDEDGDSWVIQEGVDQNGEDCRTDFVIYKSHDNTPHVATLILRYKAYTIYYRLKKNEE